MFLTEENSPIAHASPNAELTGNIFNVAVEWIDFHLVNRSAQARLIVRWDALKRLSGGAGYYDGPFFLLGGVHRVLCSRGV